jgi:signal transduction histidine kinase
MALNDRKVVTSAIRARSHVLKLLGDELIGDDGLAIFELVKNSYDADANEVKVILDIEDGSKSKIVVSDNGCGMSIADLEEKWLVLATDSKRGGDNRHRSPIFHRLPLGEKGIGRIAAFKLGDKLTLTTRAQNEHECLVTVNLQELLNQGPYLENLQVTLREVDTPKIFKGEATGTHMEISALNREVWSRADLRKILRLVTSLVSPFETPDSFSVEFQAPKREKDLEGMLSPTDFMEQSIWEFHFNLDHTGFSWEYKFKPPFWKGVESHSAKKVNDVLLLDEPKDKDKEKEKDAQPLVFFSEMLEGIGPVAGVIYGFYQRPEVLKASGNHSQLKKWLEDQTGVRVYRDRIRVFNYGEQGDDWLGLNVRRINSPGGKFGTNSVVAAISLSLEESDSLKEKTNREGFDNGGAFPRFKQLVLSVFERFEKEALDDREALDNIIRGKGGNVETPPRFIDAIENLKAGVRSKKIDASFSRDLEAIETEYAQLRDVMVNAGTAGLNLAVIFHEIEREVDALAAAVERGVEETVLKSQIEQIYYMLHGFAPLLRKNPTKMVFCSEVIEQASRIRKNRFQFHKVVFSAPILSKEEPDFKVKAVPNLLVGAIGNLLDNALYWCQVRKERDKRTEPLAIRLVTNYREDDGSSLIAIVDNGTGFSEKALAKGSAAFFSERPSGMGLGLYFANLVTEQMGGVLTLSTAEDLRDEIDVPAAFDGAAVVMRFKGK